MEQRVEQQPEDTSTTQDILRWKGEAIDQQEEDRKESKRIEEQKKQNE